MKLPKFIKNHHQTPKSATLRSSTQQQNMSNRLNQLLLTDEICRFQPTKKFLNESLNATSDFLKSSEPDRHLSALKTEQLQKILMATTPTSISNGTATPRYVKSAQPKRLQRNRLAHVNKKPSNYVSLSNTKLQANGSLSFDAVDNGIKSNQYNDVQDENQHNDNLVNQENECNRDNMVTPKSNRFSLSKLSKFVSRSALKVINGKNSNELNSNGSSPNMSISSNESVSIKNTPSVDRALVIPNEEPKEVNIYQSVEQEEEFKKRFNTQMARFNNRKLKPVMGLNSLMLNKYKQNNQCSYGFAMPNVYMLAMPINFDKMESKPKQAAQLPNANQENFPSVQPIVQQVQNTYDHLSRTPMGNISTNVSHIYQKNPIMQQQVINTTPSSNYTSAKSIANLKMTVYSTDHYDSLDNF